MQRLSGLDASFLYLETPSQLLHVCGLLTLDGATMPGGYSFPEFKRRLADRVAMIPAFRRKLHNPLWNLSHPVWVEDEDFDLDNHLHRVGLPAPGDDRELAELCAHIAGQRLDRAHPLWQCYVIEGLPGGRVAVLIKMHHASVDGVGGASLITYLAGFEPDAPLPEIPDAHGNAGLPTRLRMLRDSADVLLQRPKEVARLLPELLELVPRWVGRTVRGKGMPVPFTAPRTSLNGTITAHRTVAFAQLDLAEAKRVKNAFGVTVNDVVLALVSGALRQFLLGRGELPEDPLVGTVPVSVHGRTERDHGSNQVSAFFASLPTHLPDPAARVFFLAEANRLAKDHHYDINADMLADWAQFSPASVFGLGVRAYSALRLAERHPVVHNLIISNVPGPPVPLYLLGARVTGLFPLGPVFHGAGLNVTVLSYDGTVGVGLLGAKELVKDLWPLAEALPEALTELRKAAPA
ncbi:WS/DGAT/MGAT family O-acyltransferase [Amycolatopsis jiangsuensis]|uniref:Diacylglycerol O-acyltransferase n=1 Tax=Amycolatopsis jiangsuensis TaxID=1181879 RepID=A0A840ITU4_9PSEU|nr:wax ester/triacylglycerol synthase family O-acyltransferase [Amycolatopsis jiangsuensis]MBB4684875.1 WS/DGAT/MGAT family acyltransferase [Amycolatopsis jiangsuensis]